jgi:hypothetical protein
MKNYSKIVLLIIVLSFEWNHSKAQPLMLGWSEKLIANWRVVKIDSIPLAQNIDMFLEFSPDKVVMNNQNKIVEGRWKAIEESREIQINTKESFESWELRYIDSSNLVLYDTLGKATLHLTKFYGKFNTQVESSLLLSKADLVGNWILVSIDNIPVPKEAILNLMISSGSTLNIKIAKENKLFNWIYNKARNGIKIYPDSSIQYKEWIFTELDSDQLVFVDQGQIMRFIRYISPLSHKDEKLLASKWKIVEVGGNTLNEDKSRYMQLDSKGKMFFYTDDKKEGEGNWGINSGKDSLFILSKGATELWKILFINEQELLLEMDNLKMLLTKAI